MAPVGLVLLLLTGVGPLLAWRRSTLKNLLDQFFMPVLSGLAAGTIALLLRIPLWSAGLCFALCGFVVGTVAQEFWRGTQARHALHGEGRVEAFANLLRRNGRRYGGYIVHLGIVVIAVAVATSQAGTAQLEKTLFPGDSMRVGAYDVRLVAVRSVTEPQRDVLQAELAVSGAGSSDARHVMPALVYYPNSTQAVGSPGITASAADDVYTILVAYDTRASAWATIRVLVIPLVSWLWIGGLIVGVGALIAAMPQPVRRPVPVRVVDARMPAEGTVRTP